MDRGNCVNLGDERWRMIKIISDGTEYKITRDGIGYRVTMTNDGSVSDVWARNMEALNLAVEHLFSENHYWNNHDYCPLCKQKRKEERTTAE